MLGFDSLSRAIVVGRGVRWGCGISCVSRAFARILWGGGKKVCVVVEIPFLRVFRFPKIWRGSFGSLLCDGDEEAVVAWIGGGCAGFASVVTVFIAASCEGGGAWFNVDVAGRGVILRGISRFGWKASEASLGSWRRRLA